MKNKLFYLLRILTCNYYPFRSKRNTLLVLMFHQVNDKNSLFYPAMPVQVFKELLEFIDKYYEVIHFSEIENYYSSRNKKPAAIISFDDGNFDILQNAYPILNKLNLKFNINIDTEILETGKSQDFVRAYDILNETKIDSFMNPKFMDKPIEINKKNPIETEFEFTELLSNLTTKKRREFIDEMATITGMDDHLFSKVLSKEDLRKLSESRLVEIGSHSHSHSILTKIPSEQVVYELKHSKEILEEITGKKIEVIAYPNGVFNNSIDELSIELGYKFILKTNDKINLITQTILDNKYFERVNQYHRSIELALAHTYGIIKFIKRFSS
jgi:peptidoglycan/xylan/chitin deacetylase (PgdA/CDA1 family)